MKIKVSQTISNLNTPEEIQRYVAISLQDIITAINGHISITDNVDMNIIDVTFATIGTDTQFSHGLRRIPTGYFLIKSSIPGIISDASVGNNEQKIYLRSTTLLTGKVLVF